MRKGEKRKKENWEWMGNVQLSTNLTLTICKPAHGNQVYKMHKHSSRSPPSQRWFLGVFALMAICCPMLTTCRSFNPNRNFLSYLTCMDGQMKVDSISPSPNFGDMGDKKFLAQRVPISQLILKPIRVGGGFTCVVTQISQEVPVWDSSGKHIWYQINAERGNFSIEDKMWRQDVRRFVKMSGNYLMIWQHDGARG